MIDVEILCIGKLKEKYWKDALAEYEKRLHAYCSFKITSLKESRTDDIAEEGKELLDHIGKERYVIALDIKGREFSSEEIAGKLSSLALGGKSKVTFMIGGSNGLSNEVLERADMRLSFGPATFPHQMMRVILAEQIYRSFTIIRNESYHK